ncbi:hypothetical protein [Streptomyces boninensis]|uniref:hypothetical protein n=1 Tax=Streptomyces boninensis TaxID=2039455 RepID=UPI003B216288
MGDKERLRADYELLGTSKSNLNDIKKVLEGMEKHRDDIDNIWGADSIAGKMSEFVNNWDNYRRELLENVNDLGGRVESALKGFQKVDLDLKNKSEGK